LIYLLLGRDKQFRNITDLGGGIKTKEREAEGGVLVGGMREFEEESNGIFGDVYIADLLYEQVAIIDKKSRMAAVFFPVDPSWIQKSVTLFEEKTKNKRPKDRDEIDELVWYSQEDFTDLIVAKKTLWSPIKKFYAKSFTSDLVASLTFIYDKCVTTCA